jgi:hypothetical protein
MSRTEFLKIALEAKLNAESLGNRLCALSYLVTPGQSPKGPGAEVVQDKIFSDGKPRSSQLIGGLMDDDDPASTSKTR